MNRLRTLLSSRMGPIMIIALSMALGASLAANLMGRNVAYAADQNVVAQQKAALYDLQNAFTSLVDQVLPSVVSIESKIPADMQGMPDINDFFPGFPFQFPQPDMPEGPPPTNTVHGSGVIVRNDGYILTNDHVVGGAEKVKVRLKDGREFEGTVSRDPKSDLALVKINAKDLPAIKLGDSASVKVGSWAVAIGSPFGLDQTVTVGVISAMGRQEAASDGSETRFYPSLIQTDASINPGNSGGPLVNIEGELIGVNTLIRSSFGGGNVGIGFAIPVNTAKFVLDQLIVHGKVTRGYLGFVPVDLTPKTAERYGVKEGALVQSVKTDSPADKAGLQVEDVIVEFDGKKIKDQLDLRDTIAATAPGKSVSLVVVRNGTRVPLKATVGEAPVEEAAETPKETRSKLGFSVSSITPELADKFQLEPGVKGVVITKVSPTSTAAREGVAPGQIVIRVNGKPASTVVQFDNATKDLKSGDTLRLVLQTKDGTTFVEFTLD